MNSIIRASFSRIFKGKEFYYAAVTAFILGIIVPIIYIRQNIYEELVITQCMNIMSTFIIWIVMIFVSVFIGKDFRNEEVSYELMNGYKNHEVFLGRLISTIVVCLVIANLFLIPMYAIIFSNISYVAVLGDTSILVRYLLIMWVFVFFVIAFTVSIFLLKDIISGLCVSWLIFVVMVIGEYLDYFKIKIANVPISEYFPIQAFKNFATKTITFEYGLVIIIFYALGIIGAIYLGIRKFNKYKLK